MARQQKKKRKIVRLVAKQTRRLMKVGSPEKACR